MNLRNCPECGKVFTFIRTNLCPDCQKIDEEKYQTVRRYISEHPGVAIGEVSENTGIGEDKILRYLKQGRFSTEGMSHVNFECELCGAAINGGRYCAACQEKLTSGLKKVIHDENKKAIAELQKKREEEQKNKGPRMHTANLWSKNR